MNVFFSALLLLVSIRKGHLLELSTTYVKVGCYADIGNGTRPLPDLLGNYYYDMTWNIISDVTHNCSRLAQSKKHRYFGLQHYGECWSGKNADTTYARDGSSDACVNGVGKKGANFVYKFLNTVDQSCDMDWHSTKDLCFQISPNSTSTTALANEYCTQHQGTFHLARTSNDFLILDRLIVTLNLNLQLNTTDCVVLKDTSSPYVGVLTQWNFSMPALVAGLTPASLGTGYECAVKDVNGKWYRHSCDLKTCKILCSKNRDLSPKDGSFMLSAQYSFFKNNLLRWLIVDNVQQCAGECLMTDTCNSFNYQHKSRDLVPGTRCGLNKRRSADSAGDVTYSPDYDYYERFD